jgi:hypothetical protein
MAADLKLISDLHFAVLPRPQQCPRLLQIRLIERLERIRSKSGTYEKYPNVKIPMQRKAAILLFSFIESLPRKNR